MFRLSFKSSSGLKKQIQGDRSLWSILGSEMLTVGSIIIVRVYMSVVTIYIQL